MYLNDKNFRHKEAERKTSVSASLIATIPFEPEQKTDNDISIHARPITRNIHDV